MVKKVKPKPILVLFLLFVIICVILGCTWAYLESPVDKNDNKEIEVTIESGTNSTQIANILKNELTKSIYASFCVLLIGKLLTNFTTVAIDYTKLQKSRTDKKYLIQMKNLIFSIKKKFIITIILIIVLNFTFGYFLFIFCNVFENNQLSWVLTTIISIIINFIFPVLICLIIAVMRFISLKLNSMVILKISLCIYSII